VQKFSRFLFPSEYNQEVSIKYEDRLIQLSDFKFLSNLLIAYIYQGVEDISFNIVTDNNKIVFKVIKNNNEILNANYIFGESITNDQVITFTSNINLIFKQKNLKLRSMFILLLKHYIIYYLSIENVESFTIYYYNVLDQLKL